MENQLMEELIDKLVLDLEGVDVGLLKNKFNDSKKNNMTMSEIYTLLAEICVSLMTIHYSYGVIATRILVQGLHQKITKSFSETIQLIQDELNVLDLEFYKVCMEHSDLLDKSIKRERDYDIDYFGLKTLERSYLQKINDEIIEIPQYMFMRVALAIHKYDIDKAIQTYNDMSNKYYIHATPTLFNAGMKHQQLSSCYLVAMKDDSIDGIYETLKECAQISKWAGGIGVHIHQIRGKNSKIHSNNGKSDGIVPMLRVFNDTARYCNQAGKRPGSFAIYLEPWHCDVESFLELKKNNGAEEERARDLFYALWIPDLFMKQVESGGDWYLMCPNESKGLSDVYGDEFEKLYWRYVEEGRYRKKMSARDLWKEILISQIETGTPYMVYKDSANRKSNQQNLGTIKSSNLCVAPETLILTDKGHIEIQKMVNSKVNVWNGEEFSEVEIKKTGENQKLIEIETDDGCKLTCTEYHKFYIQNKYSGSRIAIKEAKDLQINDKIVKCSYPVVDNKKEMIRAYTHGFFCGDGTYSKCYISERQCEFKSMNGHYYCKRHIDFETINTIDKLNENKIPNEQCNAISYSRKPLIFLYGDKKKLINYIDYRSKTESSDRINLELPLDIDEKFYVPFDCSLKSKLEWFAGYCDADGTIAKNGTNKQLQVSSINYDFLKNVKLMLQTCGINPKIKLAREKGTSYLPDGKGSYKDYNTETTYRLLLTSVDLITLINLGFNTKRLDITVEKEPNRNANQFVKIKKISDNNRIDDTYCFTEPKKHMGIFNGIITGQCSEIIEYSSPDETAVCNLASIGLPKYLIDGKFNHELLGEKVRQIVRNLNNVIDMNYYPTENCKRSNMRHRPVGLGVQGLADVFMELGLDWETTEARNLNKEIFETIYYNSVLESCRISQERQWMIIRFYDDILEAIDKQGSEFFKNKDIFVHKYELPKIKERFYSAHRLNQLGAYSSFEGSPISKGKFQFDLWDSYRHSGRYDWESLKANIFTYGIRNSLLLAPMPTASTSQIFGFNECIEPITSNIYSRRTMAGEFIVVNKRLMRELLKVGLWNEDMKNRIIEKDGSIQDIPNIPIKLKDIYKTVWEIKQKTLIDMAADRGRYICQSQSLNLFLNKIDMNRLGSMHLYSWKQGLKTGIYYLRIKTIANTQKFTIEVKTNKEEEVVGPVCRKEEGCVVCSS